MARGTIAGVVAAVLFCFVVGAASIEAGERFTDNGDGTVTDHQRNLMWSQSDNQGDISWKQAERWVRFTFGDTIQASYDDWRLPTLEELKSLYIDDRSYAGYETDCGQVVRMVPAIRLTCGWVWTADTPSVVTASAFNFHRGYPYSDRMVHYRAYRALAVRDID
ncbi:MAG: DUF1566 domain-containing protein [Desulfobacterales bacterium]|jgi:hypothetical protein